MRSLMRFKELGFTDRSSDAIFMPANLRQWRDTMKDKIKTMIVCVVFVAILGLLFGCQSNGYQTRDLSHDPYNVGGFEEKG